MEIRSLECDSIELDTKAPNVTLENVTGTVEIKTKSFSIPDAENIIELNGIKNELVINAYKTL